MSKECVTHHHACDCREREFAALRERVSQLEKFIKSGFMRYGAAYRKDVRVAFPELSDKESNDE